MNETDRCFSSMAGQGDKKKKKKRNGKPSIWLQIDEYHIKLLVAENPSSITGSPNMLRYMMHKAWAKI